MVKVALPLMLEGRRIIVTGGASGIAAAFAHAGARVASLDVDDARGRPAAAEAGERSVLSP